MSMISVKLHQKNMTKGAERLPGVKGVGTLENGDLLIDYGAGTLSFGIDEENIVRAKHYCKAMEDGGDTGCWHLGLAASLYEQHANVTFDLQPGTFVPMVVELTSPRSMNVLRDVTPALVGRASTAKWMSEDTAPPLPDAPESEDDDEDLEFPGDPQRGEVVAYLKEQRIPATLVARVLRFRERYGAKEDSPQYSRVRNGRYIGTEHLSMALIGHLLGHHLLLEGPKGCGKNELADTLSWVFRQPIFELTGNYQTEKAEFLGEKTLEVQEDATTRVKHEESVLMEAMKGPHLLIVDEANAMRPEIAILLHPVEDERKRLEINGYGIVKAHPGFRVIQTMNYGYAGTSEMNEASVDRLDVLSMDANVDIRQIMKQKNPLLDKGIIEKLGKVFDTLKGAAEQGELPSAAVSIRGILAASDFIADGVTVVTAVKVGVINKLFDPMYKEIAYSMVKPIIG